jgi:hypothetical protein
MSPFLLSICIPSVSLSEISKQLASVVKLTLAYRDKVEILIKLDKSSEEDGATLKKLALQNSVKFIEQTNEGFDLDIGKLIASAQGEYIWIVSSNDLLDEDAIPNVLKYLTTNEYDLIFLNSRTPNSDNLAVSIASDAVLSDLGETLQLIGTRMSLVTSIVFRNSREKETLTAYKKYSKSAVAFLTFPFSQLSSGGKTFVIAKPQFTNFVQDYNATDIGYYNGYDTFGLALWDLVADYTSIREDQQSRAFLIKNFGHIWRGGIIDWIRREKPRPIGNIWRLRRYRISSEYWPALFLTAMPKFLVKFLLKLYKTVVRNHYS